MQKLPIVAIAFALASRFQLVGQQSIVKRCEAKKSPSRVEDNQPIPEQLKIPDAPKTAREVGCFTSLSKNSTMVDVVWKCGVPDKHMGGAGYIFWLLHGRLFGGVGEHTRFATISDETRKTREDHSFAEQLVNVVEFPISPAMGWSWVHGRLGWDGVFVLIATVALFGAIDYALLRFYERRGRAVRTDA